MNYKFLKKKKKKKPTSERTEKALANLRTGVPKKKAKVFETFSEEVEHFFHIESRNKRGFLSEVATFRKLNFHLRREDLSPLSHSILI